MYDTIQNMYPQCIPLHRSKFFQIFELKYLWELAKKILIYFMVPEAKILLYFPFDTIFHPPFNLWSTSNLSSQIIFKQLFLKPDHRCYSNLPTDITPTSPQLLLKPVPPCFVQTCAQLFLNPAHKGYLHFFRDVTQPCLKLLHTAVTQSYPQGLLKPLQRCYWTLLKDITHRCYSILPTKVTYTSSEMLLNIAQR